LKLTRELFVWSNISGLLNAETRQKRRSVAPSGRISLELFGGLAGTEDESIIIISPSGAAHKGDLVKKMTGSGRSFSPIGNRLNRIRRVVLP